MTRIIIPVENQNGLEATVARHFGQAPYYTLVEIDSKGETVRIEASPNTGEHMGGTGHPHENLHILKPDIIAAYGMGQGGLQSFRSAGTRVLKAEGNTVGKVVANFKKGILKELTGGCEHAHHHDHHHIHH